jgi:hypothetical protein
MDLTTGLLSESLFHPLTPNSLESLFVKEGFQGVEFDGHAQTLGKLRSPSPRSKAETIDVRRSFD